MWLLGGVFSLFPVFLLVANHVVQRLLKTAEPDC
jgi:hypothetical protein